MYLNMAKIRGQKKKTKKPTHFKHRKTHCNHSNVMRYALTDHIINICWEKSVAIVKKNHLKSEIKKREYETTLSICSP